MQLRFSNDDDKIPFLVKYIDVDRILATFSEFNQSFQRTNIAQYADFKLEVSYLQFLYEYRGSTIDSFTTGKTDAFKVEITQRFDEDRAQVVFYHGHVNGNNETMRYDSFGYSRTCYLLNELAGFAESVERVLQAVQRFQDEKKTLRAKVQEFVADRFIPTEDKWKLY